MSSAATATYSYNCYGQDILRDDIQRSLNGLANSGSNHQKTAIEKFYCGENKTCYVSHITLSNYKNANGSISPYYLLVDDNNKFLSVVMYYVNSYYECEQS
ncbi:Bgt-50201 [Blumeria graminis f. sp. tritici]|uniref:Bgt-50201 n=1 Tax=Blumeria graminis f. sp. tritici TaxID=62690 RepID=A0A9X9QBN9_BLUGR|nr:Bgt-50201 [Blumeria graminis f. sp. tritici]